MNQRLTTSLAAILPALAFFVAATIQNADRRDSQVDACERGIPVRMEINKLSSALKGFMVDGATVRITSAEVYRRDGDVKAANESQEKAEGWLVTAKDLNPVDLPDCEQVVK